MEKKPVFNVVKNAEQTHVATFDTNDEAKAYCNYYNYPNIYEVVMCEAIFYNGIWYVPNVILKLDTDIVEQYRAMHSMKAKAEKLQKELTETEIEYLKDYLK